MTESIKKWARDNFYSIIRLIGGLLTIIIAGYLAFNSLIITVSAQTKALGENTQVTKDLTKEFGDFKVNQAVAKERVNSLEKRVDRLEK